MITQLIKRTFTLPLFSWGNNLRTIGSTEASVKNPTIPNKITVPSTSKIIKSINGYSDSLLLNTEGLVFHQGTKELYKSNPIFEQMEQSGLKDVDCDVNNLLFLDQNGKVAQILPGNQTKSIEIPFKVKFIASGAMQSLAIAEDKEGLTHVYWWSNIMDSKVDEQYHVTRLINSKKSTVKKIRAVDGSFVILLHNGDLIVWGDNHNGNLGVPFPELSKRDFYVEKAAEPLALNQLAVKITDFDLSYNVLVLLDQLGRAYFSGFNHNLKLKAISFFENQRITRVGCNFNYYYLLSDTGVWYMNRPFENQDLVKFHGVPNLYQLDDSFFDHQTVESISGKYENAFALIKTD